MFCLAKKIVGNQDTVSDIVQEVFIDFYEMLNCGNEIHYPGRWLYRATTNKCIDNLRKQKKFQGLQSLKDKEAELSDQEDRAAMINLALSKLEPREKILAVLYSEGFSYKEIAAATGIKSSSVGKMLSRTLKKIENEFTKQRYELY